MQSLFDQMIIREKQADISNGIDSPLITMDRRVWLDYAYQVEELENKLAEPIIIHLPHGLTLMVTPKNKLLCFDPNVHSRAAYEMWLAHTEERLRQNVRLGLITKGD